MLGARRNLLTLIVAAAGLAACADKAADDAATTTADSAAPVAADIQPPADLKTVTDDYLAAWQAEDATKLAGFFAEDAMVQDDTTMYMGRKDIQDKWLAPNLTAITALHIEGQKWSQAGADYRVDGRWHMTLNAKGAPAEAKGTYDETWTKGADGAWKLKSVNVKQEAAPPPPPAATTGL